MFYYGREWSKNKTIDFIQQLINKSQSTMVLENCANIHLLENRMDIEKKFLSWMILDSSQLLRNSK
jgi:hypothetical protein